MMATEAIKLITGVGAPLVGRLLFIDVLAATQRELPLVARGPRTRPPAVLPTPVADTEPGGATLVSPADLADQLSGAHAPFVLDVRESAELDFGVIDGSTHIPLARITDGDAGSLGIPRDRPVVVVCKAGARATLAATTLAARGYDGVRVLTGGMVAWARDVDPTMTPY